MRALVRERSPLDELAGLDIELAYGDVLDRASVRRAMRGVQRVFHVAGMTSLRASADRVFAVNVGGTRIVLEEALRAGVARVVHTSSVAAVGPGARAARRPTRTRSSAPGATGCPTSTPSTRPSWRRMRMAAHGLPVVVVNPAHVFGAGDRHRSSTELVRRFLRGQIPAYVDGALNIVDAEDVAAATCWPTSAARSASATSSATATSPSTASSPTSRGCRASSRRRSSSRWRPRSRWRAPPSWLPAGRR